MDKDNNVSNIMGILSVVDITVKFIYEMDFLIKPSHFEYVFDEKPQNY